jgi:hypothetical protein
MSKKKAKKEQTGTPMSEEKAVALSPNQELEALESEIDRARLELERTKQQLEEKKKQLESVPAIVDKQVTVSNKSLALKEKIAAMKEYDNQKVTGKFINRRAPGHIAKLTYMKYEDDPVKWYDFKDGGVYTIPRGFADQINEHYYTPHFIQKQASDMILIGNESPGELSTIAEVDTSNKKYAFVPVNF